MLKTNLSLLIFLGYNGCSNSKNKTFDFDFLIFLNRLVPYYLTVSKSIIN
jgi:hypothetical protein